ncbi:MAG: DUF4424 family protein [Bacteroidetes bacterium]|nr:DUF4424 family protein [Bacteroidota bacterium]
MSRILFSLLLVSINFCLFSQNIAFTEETINFEISNDTFFVSGNYTFKNNSDKIMRQLVYYPIYTSTDQLPYDTVSVFEYKSKTELKIKKSRDHIIIPIKVNPKSKTTITINYSQRILDSLAIYILTSTKTWNAPLKKVNYIISTKNDCPQLLISLPPNKIKKRKTQTVYLIKKRNFMPTEELILYYKKRKKY